MKKHLFKNLLIFGIIILLTSCSEDLYEEELNSSNNKTTIKEMKFDELFKDKKFHNLLNKITNYKAGNNSNTARSTFENQNGFTISNEVVKIITNDSTTSYTMLVERDSSNSQSTDFENLVIQETNLGNDEKAFLIKYMPNQIVTSTHNSFTFDGTIQKSKLAFTGFNKSTYENTIQSDCYVDVLMCNESWSGGVSHVAGESCRNIRFLYVKKVQVLCADDGGISGGGGGGGDSGSGGSGGGDGTGSPDDGTGSPDPNDSENEEDVITSPVKPGLDGEGLDETPCGRMEKKSNNIKFREKLKELNTSTNFNKVYETGYYEKYDGTFNYMSGTSLNPSLGTKPGMTSYMHVHMNYSVINNEDGTQTISYAIKMPSPGDIASLTTCAGNALQNNLSPYDSYGVMISNEGIFSVNLTDTDIVLSKALQADMNFSFGMKASKIFGQTLPNSPERKEALQKMLLQLLKDKGLGNKVALYEAEVVIDPSQPQALPTVKWKKKSLDANGNLVETPC